MEVAEREVQKNYWCEHSKELTLEAMMLDSRATDLDKEERPEVSSTLIRKAKFLFFFPDAFIFTLTNLSSSED